MRGAKSVALVAVSSAARCDPCGCEGSVSLAIGVWLNVGLGLWVGLGLAVIVASGVALLSWAKTAALAGALAVSGTNPSRFNVGLAVSLATAFVSSAKPASCAMLLCVLLSGSLFPPTCAALSFAVGG